MSRKIWNIFLFSPKCSNKKHDFLLCLLNMFFTTRNFLFPCTNVDVCEYVRCIYTYICIMYNNIEFILFTFFEFCFSGSQYYIGTHYITNNNRTMLYNYNNNVFFVPHKYVFLLIISIFVSSPFDVI